MIIPNMWKNTSHVPNHQPDLSIDKGNINVYIYIIYIYTYVFIYLHLYMCKYVYIYIHMIAIQSVIVENRYDKDNEWISKYSQIIKEVDYHYWILKEVQM